MAIPFLNNITLDNNEIQNVRLHNTGTSNNAAGQIFFNTGVNLAEYYANSIDQWVALKEYSFGDGDYIDANITGTAAKPIITPDLSATAVSGNIDNTKYLRGDNKWAEVSAIPGTYTWILNGDSGTQTIESGNTVTFIGGTKITTVAAATDTLTITHDPQSQSDTASSVSPAAGATFTVIDSVVIDTTGHIGGKNIKTITLPADTNTQETYTLPVSVGTAVTGYTVADIDLTAAGTSTGIKSKVTFAGKDSNIAITETAGNNGIVNIALTTDVVIDGNLSVGGDINQTSPGNENVFASELNMGSLNITNLLDPTSPQEAATKQYVDDATVGGLIYQGGYNSSTNVPVLDSRGTQIAVEKGWTYTVTADGTFYGEAVRVGDVLIAEVDLASGAGALTDWTTVQNNIDLASASQIGIGNVAASTVDDQVGLSVTYANPTDGTATVGLDIDSLATETLPPASDMFIPYINDQSGENKKASLRDLVLAAQTALTKKGTITAGSLFGTVSVSSTWGLDTMVQTVNEAGDTVFCDITRTTTSVVATIAAAEATDITILVQKIG